jgi:uncharacterized protein
MNPMLVQFEDQQYLNIETFRKNGQGVKTPVWFAQEGETLYIWTESTSGKAKRIRNNHKINVVPSKGDGTPVGEWVAATAKEQPDAQSLKKVDSLFTRKYGFQKKMFGLLGLLRKAKYTAIEVALNV